MRERECDSLSDAATKIFAFYSHRHLLTHMLPNSSGPENG